MRYEYLKSYIKKRGEFSQEELDSLSTKLHDLKKSAIENLDSLVKTSVKALEKSGVHVHRVDSDDEARKVVSDQIGSAKNIVKSKSNTAKEIKLEKLGIDINETDLGDFIASITDSDSGHAVLPAINLAPKDIAGDLSKKFSEDIAPDPLSITRSCMKKIRQNILEAEVGITGANAITATGEIVILENEGNISLVSRIPEKHIVIAGIEKIVPTVEDAMTVARCAAIWGTAQDFPSYVSIIKGPSQTADIGNKLVVGAQGAKEVHLVLIDDWRSEFAIGEFKEMLYCINCGACETVCPVFNTTGQIVKILDPKLNYLCTTCTSCTVNCPAKIRWDLMNFAARKGHIKSKKDPKQNREMIANIRKYGNPFGKSKGKITKYYCC